MVYRFKAARISILMFLFLPAFSFQAWGQQSQVDFNISSSIDWVRGELNSELSFELAQAGIKLPTGRLIGEDILKDAYPRFLRSSILSIKVDSNSTVRNLVDRGELSLERLDILSKEAGKIPPSLSADLTRMTGRYKFSMESAGNLLTLHRRAVEPEKPMLPVMAADYTGIIIIADEELPVHGRRIQAIPEPCLFPKIWDTNMNLIYERNMYEPGRQKGMVRYVLRESIMRPTPSGLDAELLSLVGPNPMRILARQIFGINPTDPVIDHADAMQILSTENNRRLLREGRVVLVMNEFSLKF